MRPLGPCSTSSSCMVCNELLCLLSLLTFCLFHLVVPWVFLSEGVQRREKKKSWLTPDKQVKIRLLGCVVVVCVFLIMPCNCLKTFPF